MSTSSSGVIALLVDEDAMSHPLVRALHERGLDVVTVGGEGLRGVIDEEVLVHGAKQGRVIYTFNAGHFCRIHRQWQMAGKTHSGIVIGDQQRFGIRTELRLLLKLISSKSAQELVNQLQFLSNWR